jgi:glycosyltransferase involved in cell wall biosynthesis
MVTDSRAEGTAELAAALTWLGHTPVLHDITRAPGRTRDAVAWFTELWQTTRPAVVHNQSRVAGAAAVSAAALLSIPSVHTAGVVDDLQVGTREHDLISRADRVIVSCTAERAELTAKRIPRNLISVVPHGVDTDHFTPEGDHPRAGRRHRLVAVGELTPSTGFATAVAALAGLPDTELVIAGSPPRGVHAKDLRAYARRLGVADRLHLAGPVDRSELPGLLRSASVAVVTPWRPRFGIAAVEAAACGTAVVASDTGGLADTIVDQVTGLLVSPRRPRTLAAAVWKLLANPLLIEQYGATARERACSRYSWRQIAVDTLAAYHQAGAEPPATRRRARTEAAH